MTPRLQGWRGFTGRHVRLFRAVWAERATLDGPTRTRDEIAFLPAHLELTETPVSPAARWTLRIIMALFAIALLWACVGKVDIVAVAPGRVVASGGTKTLQPMETAVVRRILVRDGERVRAGQLLIELDATIAQADVSKAGDALLNARLAQQRYGAIAEALRDGRMPRLQPAPEVPTTRWQAEQALAASEMTAFRERADGLRAGIDQRRAEIGTITAMLGPLAETVRIARLREADYARLLQTQYVGRHDYLLRQQERIAAERDLAGQRSRLVEARSALRGAQEQLAGHTADFTAQTLERLRQANEQMLQFAPELRRSAQRDRQLALRAPVDGTVQQLAVHTVGGVVTPAQPLLMVVPSADVLEVEAIVMNRDIGFVRVGQPVTVKVESFPYTRFGALDGTVVSVSHDAAQDERLGLVFPARVRLRRSALDIDGTTVRLTPGMALSVEIKTGRRRLIDYLLSPLRTAVGEAGRER